MLAEAMRSYERLTPPSQLVEVTTALKNGELIHKMGREVMKMLDSQKEVQEK